jgi:hypothetical protein
MAYDSPVPILQPENVLPKLDTRSFLLLGGIWGQIRPGQAWLAGGGAATARKYKLPPSLMIARACLESDFGRNPRARAQNTLFSIAKRSELIDKKEFDRRFPITPGGRGAAFRPSPGDRRPHSAPTRGG